MTNANLVYPTLCGAVLTLKTAPPQTLVPKKREPTKLFRQTKRSFQQRGGGVPPTGYGRNKVLLKIN